MTALVATRTGGADLERRVAWFLRLLDAYNPWRLGRAVAPITAPTLPLRPPAQQPPEAELAAKERGWLDPEHGHHHHRAARG